VITAGEKARDFCHVPRTNDFFILTPVWASSCAAIAMPLNRASKTATRAAVGDHGCLSAEIIELRAMTNLQFDIERNEAFSVPPAKSPNSDGFGRLALGHLP
jgi:hypothetical protein